MGYSLCIHSNGDSLFSASKSVMDLVFNSTVIVDWIPPMDSAAGWDVRFATLALLLDLVFPIDLVLQCLHVGEDCLCLRCGSSKRRSS